MTRPLDINRLLDAARHIDPVFLETPLLRGTSLDALLGCELLLKVESLNPIRSFKGRGTELFAATEPVPGVQLVCASAGNFGQGLARAARRRGFACTVFAAETASPLKIAAMRRLGAVVELVGADFDAAKVAARQHAAATGARFVEDGAEPAIAEGAGTIGLELAAAVPGLETVVVPLGNGALLAGIGAAFRHAAPHARIVAGVAAGAPAMQRSLEAGRPVETERADTIADGIAVRVPVPEALAMLDGRCDAVVAVSEADIIRAMAVAIDHLGLVIEPAGAAGLAAILADPAAFAGRRVATVLAGGNVTREQLAGWLPP
jgi:threonine dehydratase